MGDQERPADAVPTVPAVLMNQRGWRKLLIGNGWAEEHVVKMTKPGQRPITLPMHKGRTYSKGLDAAIRRQAGLQ